MKTSHFYTWEDQYGIRVSATTHAAESAKWAAYHCQEVFRSRGEAQAWITATIAEGAVWGPGGKA